MGHNWNVRLITFRLHLSLGSVPVPPVCPPILRGLVSTRTMILVIGHLRLDGKGHPALLRQGYRFASLAELDGALLREIAPQMVLSALIGDSFDALEVARHLSCLGYAGPYRVLSPQLPSPGLVLSEIRAAAPGLDVDLLMVSHGPDRPA